MNLFLSKSIMIFNKWFLSKFVYSFVLTNKRLLTLYADYKPFTPPRGFKMILLFSLVFFSIGTFSQGIQFQGNEKIINERTSYNVFSKNIQTFNNYLSISFDILFSEPSNAGSILRIKDLEQNITYNLSYNATSELVTFKFNIEGRINLISSVFSSKEIEKHRWHKITVFFDMKNDSVFLDINKNRQRASNINLTNKLQPQIVFGKSDYVIDVPTFAIRNLVIESKNKQFIFLLNEQEGGIVFDKKGKAMGCVENPVWLINNANNWELKTKLISDKVAGANFNEQTQEIFYFNADSITFYNVLTNEIRKEKYSQDCPMSILLGTNFIDTRQSKLYVYEVWRRPRERGSTTISTLDLNNLNWETVSTQQLPMQLHHHAGYFDIENNRYIIFGGFGNNRYSKDFCSYNLNTNSWDTLVFEGDKITPRYFSSIGNFNEEKKLYLYGGMGNEAGDHTIGRIYYYDFYEIDLESLRIKKLWELSNDNNKVVPVRGMIVNDSSFCTLCYPEYVPDSYLKLLCFNINNGQYEILGDSIPIRSDKINTNANLYLNEKDNKLYVTVQEFDEYDTASTLSVYSLSFSEILDKEELEEVSGYNCRYIWIILFLLISLSAIIFYLLRKSKQKSAKIESKTVDENDNKEISLNLTSKNQEKANATYIFGNFSVRDKNKKEINYMFSAKIKQIFCLILQNSMKNGITSQQLSEFLWPDRDESQIKNIRGVTINHLRKILNELNGICLVHEKGFYKFIISDEYYCDYLRCFELINNNSLENEDFLNEFTTILERGKFLSSDDSPAFDTFKQMIESKLEPVLLLEIEKTFNAEKYKTTLILAEAIFNFDPVNEKALTFLIQALVKLKKHDEAKKRYIQFSIEYKRNIGEDFSKSFNEIQIKY